MQREQTDSADTKQQIRQIAGQIMALAHDGLLMNLRFLDVALAKLSVVCREETGAHLFDGAALYYDPALLLRQYQNARGYGARLLLHTLLHCVFSHGFGAKQTEARLWDLATDIAVESVILDLSLHLTAMPGDDELRSRLELLKKQAGSLTAERLYRHFRIEEPSEKALKDWRRLCHYDEHIYWDRREELELPAEQWKKLAERIRADLKSFSKGKNNAERIEENLRETLRERYDYTDFLKRFMVMGESIRASDEEFDYIYYTYGLTNYGNMPLVEPLEYKDEKRIRDFVIALDTSASCRGKLIQTFLQKTYGIMRERESFFTKINVHILQCDSEVRQDTKITAQEDFDAFLAQGKLTGFGSTDFRPVFDYVEKLREEGDLTDLKGLIYFTDGYGVYPEYMPDYDVAFVFLREDDNAPKVPPWAIRLVLEEEDLEEDGT
ncbi:MAG: VWA-like domain-containing protein [Bacteroidales bacterium]|nr:VWA-like domain-containing protein [Bacteroidales bacterium]MCM1416517.1 VWA-like domain-containing protein [bacterium]MCM1424495.1 VWA-like domain-containing protein [bacterium]